MYTEMKKVLISLAIAVLASVASINSAFAQIKYNSEGLLIGNISQRHSYYEITAATSGIYFKPNSNLFLQVDVVGAGGPRIAGHSNRVNFYNVDTKVYNSIAVSQVFNYSDARAKTGIQNFNQGMNVIRQLRPVSYNFIGNQRRQARSNQYTGANAEIGLLAQELEEVLPNLVFTDEEGRKHVDYISLIPVLIDAVQSLQQEVDALKSSSYNK